MITRFRDSFWNDDYSHDNREKDLSAVTLDSGNLLIMGGGENNIEINKLKNDVVSQIGNLQYVWTSKNLNIIKILVHDKSFDGANWLHHI